jgi:hypothetical protein
VGEGQKYKFDLLIVNNITAPNIPVGGRLKPISNSRQQLASGSTAPCPSTERVRSASGAP